jgi:hypothetical protein
MKETVGIIGLTTKHGEVLSHTYFEGTLALFVEGATVQYGRGLWKGTWEECAIVTIAGNVRKSKAMFIKLGRILRQAAVYVRLPSEVQIVNC